MPRQRRWADDHHPWPANTTGVIAIAVGSQRVAPYALDPAFVGTAPTCRGQLAPLDLVPANVTTAGSGGFPLGYTVPNMLALNDLRLSHRTLPLAAFAPGGIVVSNGVQVQFGIRPRTTVIAAQGPPTVATGTRNGNYAPVAFFGWQRANAGSGRAPAGREADAVSEAVLFPHEGRIQDEGLEEADGGGDGHGARDEVSAVEPRVMLTVEPEIDLPFRFLAAHRDPLTRPAIGVRLALNQQQGLGTTKANPDHVPAEFDRRHDGERTGSLGDVGKSHPQVLHFGDHLGGRLK